MPAKRNALEALNTNSTYVGFHQAKKVKIAAKDTQLATVESAVDLLPAPLASAGSSAKPAGKKPKAKNQIQASSLPGLPDFELLTVPFQPHQGEVSSQYISKLVL